MKNKSLLSACLMFALFNSHHLHAQPKATPKATTKPQTKPKASAQNKSDTLAKTTKTLTLVREWTPVQRDSMQVMKNTAVTQACGYMTELEKEVIWYLNVARMYPQWYLYFFLQHPQTDYEKSLYTTLKNRKSASKTLEPDKALFEIAKCHAITSGKVGYVGHERQSTSCKTGFSGECCQYGYNDGAKIVLDLLIDEGIPSLGHRNIILDTTYTRVGVSIQEHKTYRHNAVLDFGD